MTGAETGGVWDSRWDRDHVQWLKQQVFGNHLILERLVLAVHTEDLAAFRMVCRAWYMASVERFEKDATINVHAFIYYFDLYGHSKDNLRVPKVTLRKLASELEAGRKLFGLEKPLSFQKYKIKYGCLVDIDLDHTLRQDGFHIQGSFYKFIFDRLAINADNYDEQYFLPALESLTLNEICMPAYNGDSHDLAPPLSWEAIELGPTPFWAQRSLPTRLSLRGPLRVYAKKELLPHWRELKELHLDTTSCRTMKRDYERMFGPETKPYICYDPNEKLNVPLQPQDRSYAGLVTLNFPKLECLSLHLEPDVSDHSIQLVLETYADRLKSLKLSRYPFAISPPSHDFPFTRLSLFQLTRMELAGNVSANLDFLLLTPSLRKLLIDQLCFGKVRCVKFEEDRDPLGHGLYDRSSLSWGNEDGTRPECSFLDMPNLTGYYTPFRGDLVKASKLLLETSTPFLHRNLTHLEVDTEWGADSLSTLAQWVPGLTTLKTVLNNATLRSVCQLWPRLEYLKLLFGSLVDDHGVLGMAGCSSSLARMPPLRHFELENLCHHPKLTDLSAQRLFLQLPKLTALIICSAQMTEPAVEALEWSISHVRIGSHSTQNGALDCCKRSWFLRKIGRLD